MFRTRSDPFRPRCKNHPKRKLSPGVCSACLSEKLSRIPTSTPIFTPERDDNNNDNSSSSSFSSLSSSDISTGESSSPMSPSTVARLCGRSAYRQSAYLRHAVSDVSTKPLMSHVNAKPDLNIKGKRKVQTMDNNAVLMEKSPSCTSVMKKGRFFGSKLSPGSGCCRNIDVLDQRRSQTTSKHL